MSWFEKLHETFIASGHYKLILNGFNLLPALPLDGGRILLALTSSSFTVKVLGIITAAVLGSFSLITGKWQWLMPCIFLFVSAFRSE